MTGSQSAYARHRKELGLIGASRRAVQKALASGRITAGSDGQIEFARADHDWEANLNHRKRPAGRSQVIAQEQTETDDGAAVHLGTNGIPPESFLEAQRRHEWLKVEKEDLVLRVRRAELVKKAEVESEYGALLTAFRQRMLLLPDKLAPRVAVIGEVMECRALIEREVREVLSALSEYQTNAA